MGKPASFPKWVIPATLAGGGLVISCIVTAVLFSFFSPGHRVINYDATPGTPVVVLESELLDQFTSNAATFESVWKGRKVRLTGDITRITVEGHLVAVELSDGVFRRNVPRLVCYFSRNADLSRVGVGQGVVIEGVVDSPWRNEIRVAAKRVFRV